MIVGAYMLGTGALKPLQADAISPTMLLKSIATKDSDHDGLPNWEEALYGTNPYKADTFGLGMTDGEAVAKGLIVPKAFKLPSTVSATTTTPYGIAPKSGTLTDLFSKNVLASYLTQKALNHGAKLSKQQLDNIVQQALNQINVQVAKQPPYRTLSQIKVSGSGVLAMKAYAATVQKIFLKYTVKQDRGELIYMQEALQDPKTASVPLTYIRAISKVYKNAATSLAQMTVPTEVAQAHLELINTYARMADILEGLSKVNSDPIVAIIALSEYGKGVLSLTKAFADMSTVFQSANVILTPSDPGYPFINVANRITSIQQQNP